MNSWWKILTNSEENFSDRTDIGLDVPFYSKFIWFILFTNAKIPMFASYANDKTPYSWAKEMRSVRLESKASATKLFC